MCEFSAASNSRSVSRNFQPGQIYSPSDSDLGNDLWGPFAVMAAPEEGYLYIVQALPLAGGSFEVRDNWPSVQEVDAYLDGHPVELKRSFPDPSEAIVELRTMLDGVEGYSIDWNVMGVPEPDLSKPRLDSVEGSLDDGKKPVLVAPGEMDQGTLIQSAMHEAAHIADHGRYADHPTPSFEIELGDPGQ